MLGYANNVSVYTRDEELQRFREDTEVLRTMLEDNGIQVSFDLFLFDKFYCSAIIHRIERENIRIFQEGNLGEFVGLLLETSSCLSSTLLGEGAVLCARCTLERAYKN